MLGPDAKKKTNHLALLALVLTCTLLFLSHLTRPWQLYEEVPFLAQDEELQDAPAAPTNKVAVILETRPLGNLVPLILHFSSILGPEWPIHIFTSPLNAMAFQLCPSFNRLLNSGGVHLQALPPGVPEDYPFHEPYSRSVFLTQSWLWERLEPAEHVFFFTSNSMICAKAEKTLDDFLEYDFIGAPMGRKLGAEVGEGESAEFRGGKEVCCWFALGEEPFGYELVQVADEKMDDVLRWCPEYVISMFNMTL
ncbi:hypothetical protein D0Z07_1308 [Hyphodiscus hymeniophilus]|uniref:DUF5672 domain-containing protein n=1 Tax=Hyphodiscus hymeniophilus TaxID=353542 RepID=A0A9P6VR67_9HELO|nr:hypothetical protein D0Z07_1308 [Hyphodiscus hymeniophilus]